MEDLKSAVMQWGQNGFCCSQIMILAGLAFTGKENEDLTAAMNGLCKGAFSPYCTCGALTGACCLLGFYAGKGAPWEGKDPRLAMMIGELQDWFKDRWAAGEERVSCGDILKNIAGTEPMKCFPVVFETLERALGVLKARGFDIQEGRST